MEITNAENTIDSREVIGRISELESQKEDGSIDSNELDELTALKALAEEAAQYSEDWVHGSTLIRETYFTDYCEQMVDDVGDLPRDIPSYLVIDWNATAENLKVDYTEVDFDGVGYLIR